MLKRHEHAWPITVGDETFWVKDSIGECSNCFSEAYLVSTVEGRDKLYCETCIQIFNPYDVESEARCPKCDGDACCLVETRFQCPICRDWLKTDEEAVAHCSDGIRTKV